MKKVNASLLTVVNDRHPLDSLKTFNAFIGRVRTWCVWRLVGCDIAEKAYREV